jgi:hypothetical protein
MLNFTFNQWVFLSAAVFIHQCELHMDAGAQYLNCVDPNTPMMVGQPPRIVDRSILKGGMQVRLPFERASLTLHRHQAHRAMAGKEAKHVKSKQGSQN